MKKYLFLAVAATAMFASCSNDEVVEMAQGRTIAFESFVNKSTRAMTETTVDNLGSITVNGWRGTDLLFNNTAVTIAADGKGTYTDTKYWEAGKTYSFEAIKEVTGATYTPNQTGGTIEFDNTTAGGNAITDLVYAKVNDVTIADDLSNTNTVGFVFNHLLSRVMFTFTNGFVGSDAKISISELKINNTLTKGTVIPGVTSGANGNVTWSHAADFSNPVSFATTTEVSASEKIPSEAMVLIPAKNTYNITFTATLNQNGVKTSYPRTATIALDLKAGYSYNLTATLTPKNISEDGDELKPIEFSASVYKWEDYTENGVELAE